MKLFSLLLASSIADQCSDVCKQYDEELNLQINRELGEWFRLWCNSLRKCVSLLELISWDHFLFGHGFPFYLNQHNKEASNFYLALSYTFSTQELNRPNFAKLLTDRSNEERDHALKLAQFRGQFDFAPS